ncbi:MAG: bifunctional UDP-N-acetylglucosamine diphosphorylase/glucosamine-1-phosphate N-acetyltransferase GlmU [Firmicutes bacterium]|jgi:bifunctional UDP-N-acetylglucosamine pyrophosphorylase/glucosamine-1-phosphate N-acetyltransferase|nr:bifunctional UDP-N-acetylglucosamine diphosphorylase/glucosamine-1-phosphate N-acetyltransferase GlmU [Bacillota bacterium]
MAQLAAIVLAAGQGTRMCSRRAKVLHKVCGKPMVSHVVDSLRLAGVTKIIVVIGHQGEKVKEAMGAGVEFVLQEERLGTGHAVGMAKDIFVGHEGHVMVLAGDTPLLRPQTLKELAAVGRGFSAAVLTARMPDPGGYGRVIRGADGTIVGIVEERDASPAQLAMDEVNTGTYIFRSQDLFPALERIKPDNAQGEYYLTDVIGLLVREGKAVAGHGCREWQEAMGINDRVQLAFAEGVLRERIRRELMLSGVTIYAPESVFIDMDVEVGQDTIIHPFCFLEGRTVVGEECVIGPGVRITDCELGRGVEVQNAILVGSKIGDGVRIGPYAYLRPGNIIEERVKIGDFVEVKNSRVGSGSKVPHLTYVGDAIIGEGVNIGAGVITCNYDGRQKHQTIIEDDVFVGSNANLIAPVTIRQGAYVAAGSTITKDVPSEGLGIARARQDNREGWARKRKERADK